MQIRRIVFIFFSVFVIIFMAKGWQLVTDGFRIDKIETDLSIAKVESAFNEQDILPYLNQKFHYLSKGCQAFVFESEDKKLVIKFVRYHKYQVPFWVDLLTFCDFGKEYAKTRSAQRMHNFTNTFNSYKLSEKLALESGVLYVHLFRTGHLHQQLELVTRLGQTYVIDLDRFGFILQRKAESFEKALLSCKSTNNMFLARQIIESFFAVSRELALKGIVDSDYNCVRNCALLDGKVIHMDLGSFKYIENLQDSAVYEKQLHHNSKFLLKWIAKNFSELSPVFHQKLEQSLRVNQKKSQSL